MDKVRNTAKLAKKRKSSPIIEIITSRASKWVSERVIDRRRDLAGSIDFHGGGGAGSRLVQRYWFDWIVRSLNEEDPEAEKLTRDTTGWRGNM